MSSEISKYRAKPLAPKFRKAKKQEIEEINSNLEGKTAILIGDSIMKNIQRFAHIKYNDYFLISTVLNAAISGDTVEAILYRVESMNFPKSVSNISLPVSYTHLTLPTIYSV